MLIGVGKVGRVGQPSALKSAGASPLIWDVDNSSSEASLSNSDQTVQFTGSDSNRTAIVNRAFSGKSYCEIELGGEVSDTGVYVGVFESAIDGTSLATPSALGVTVIRRSTGDLWQDTSMTAAGYVYTATSVVMIAYDPTTRKLWMGADGSWFNSGDPAADTGEITTLLSGTYSIGWIAFKSLHTATILDTQSTQNYGPFYGFGNV